MLKMKSMLRCVPKLQATIVVQEELQVVENDCEGFVWHDDVCDKSYDVMMPDGRR